MKEAISKYKEEKEAYDILNKRRFFLNIVWMLNDTDVKSHYSDKANPKFRL